MTAPNTTIKPVPCAKKTRPAGVNWALAALWTAWTISLVALLVNQVIFKGSGIGPGWGAGIVGSIAQAVLFVFVGRGSFIARALTIAFLVLAALPLPILDRLITEKFTWSAIYLGAGFALKAIAVFLLFTTKAKE